MALNPQHFTIHPNFASCTYVHIVALFDSKCKKQSTSTTVFLLESNKMFLWLFFFQFFSNTGSPWENHLSFHYGAKLFLLFSIWCYHHNNVGFGVYTQYYCTYYKKTILDSLTFFVEVIFFIMFCQLERKKKSSYS